MILTTEVTEITEKAVRGSRTKISTRIMASIIKPKYNGDGLFQITDDRVCYDGWNWSTRSIPPIRQNAIVICRPDGHQVELSCRVLGLSKGIGGRPDFFVFEGIKVMKNLQPHGSGRAANWKGHRFTASTECVTKIVDEGKGQRLLIGPYLSSAEERELFVKQFGDEDD